MYKYIHSNGTVQGVRELSRTSTRFHHPTHHFMFHFQKFWKQNIFFQYCELWIRETLQKLVKVRRSSCTPCIYIRYIKYMCLSVQKGVRNVCPWLLKCNSWHFIYKLENNATLHLIKLIEIQCEHQFSWWNYFNEFHIYTHNTLHLHEIVVHLHAHSAWFSLLFAFIFFSVLFIVFVFHFNAEILKNVKSQNRLLDVPFTHRT